MPFQIISGDITTQVCDAIVNPTDPVFSGGGGADRAIHQAAGAKLHTACSRLPRLNPGTSAITKGYNLPAKWVIHTAGPFWVDGNHDERRILGSCYRSALKLAAEYGLQSVAFPLIAAGTCGFPKEEALTIAVEQIRQFLRLYEMEITLVVYDRNLYRIDPRTASDVERYLDANYSGRMQSFQAQNARPARPEMRRPQEEQERYDYHLSDASFAPAAPMSSNAYPSAPAPSLADRLKKMDESFSEAVLRLVDERGMTDAQCYKRANISKQVFSKLRSNSRYKPSKATAMALAVALELDLDETRSLLNKAGMTLSRSLMMDVIVEYFIQQNRYDVMEINETLYQYDQPLLGAK